MEQKASQVLAPVTLRLLQQPELLPEVAYLLVTELLLASFLSCPHKALTQRRFKKYRRARADSLPGFAWTDVLELLAKLTKMCLTQLPLLTVRVWRHPRLPSHKTQPNPVLVGKKMKATEKYK